YKQSVFSFEFVALSYASPEQNQYAYKLEGFDKAWNYVGNKNFATYTNLDPGTYTFRVKASNNDNIWNEEGASVKITIAPPYWQTWWFRILTGIMLGGSLIATVSYRVRRIETKKRALEVEVEKRTHDLQKANLEVLRQKEYLQEQT